MSFDRTAWLAERRLGIGGSDIAAVLGTDRFKTPLDVYRDKIGEVKDEGENIYMIAGRHLEPVVADWYGEVTGNIVEFPEKIGLGHLTVHPEVSHFRATLDRVIGETTKKRAKDAYWGALEIKTTQLDFKEIHPSWYCQLQWQLGVSGLSWGALTWLVRGVELYHDYFEADRGFITDLQTEADKFWRRHVLAKLPPDPVNSADVLSLFPRHVTGKIVQAKKNVIRAVDKLRDVKAHLKELEEEEKQITDTIKTALLDGEALADGGEILLTWKAAKDGQVFNVDAFAKDHPDLYTEYLTTKPGSRRLLLK